MHLERADFINERIVAMCQCFYCANRKVTTPEGVKSFEDFVDLTSVECKLGMKTGCDYCPKFADIDEVKKTPSGSCSTCKK